MRRVPACFCIALHLCLVAVLAFVAGCRSQPSASSKPQVIRAGHHWHSSAEELTEADERAIEASARFGAGIIGELDDNEETALEHYRAAVANDPTNDDLTIEIARKLVGMRRLEDARQILEASTRRKNASGLVWGWLGTVLSLQGNPTGAIAANQEAIRRMPRNISGYQNLAQIYIGSGQITNAIAVLEEAANQPDTDSTFLIVLADTLGLLQQLKDPAVGNLRPRIVALLDRAASLNPERPPEILRLADLYQLFGQRSKARPLYEELLKSSPDLPGLRERLFDVYLQADDREKAREQLRILAAGQPTNPLPFYYLGILALEGEKFDEAVSAFNQVLLLRPDNPSIHFDLAVAHLRHQHPQEALTILERARAHFRPSFQLEYYTAIALSDLKRYEEAMRHYTAAEVIAGATAPDQLTYVFYFQSGITCERAKRIDDAALQFEKSLELKPDFADAMNYLGYMWAERATNLLRAHELIQKAVEIEPENPAFLDSLAWVLHQLGRSSEALPHQLRAIELSKEPDATLFDHLGDIYQRLEKTSEAQTAWKRSLKVEPNQEIEEKLRATEKPKSVPESGTTE